MADTLDVIDVDEAKSAINQLNIDGPRLIDLELLVTDVSRAIDDFAGPVVARAVTEYHDGGSASILLRSTPIVSITSITEYDTSGVATALSAEDFDTKPTDGYLLESRERLVTVSRRSAGSVASFASGQQNVVVVTSACRYADTATVDAKFKRRAARIVAYQWKQDAPRWARGASVPIDFDEGDSVGYITVEEMVARDFAREGLGPVAVA